MAARPRNWPANLNQNGAGYFYWREPNTKKDYRLGRDQAKAFPRGACRECRGLETPRPDESAQANFHASWQFAG